MKYKVRAGGKERSVEVGKDRVTIDGRKGNCLVLSEGELILARVDREMRRGGLQVRSVLNCGLVEEILPLSA